MLQSKHPPFFYFPSAMALFSAQALCHSAIVILPWGWAYCAPICPPRAAESYRFRAVSPRTIAKSGTTTLLRKRRVSARLTPPAPVRKNGFLLDSKEPDWSKLPPQGRQPQHGDRRKEMLEDIAILTGGTVISSAVDLTPLRSAATAQARGCRHQHARPEREDQHRLLWLRTPMNQSNVVSNEDEKLGIEIIRRAVEEPLRMIVECCGCRTCRGNAGLEGSVVVNEVKNGGNRGGSAANGYSDYGYNARAEKYENLFKSGVIDPAKERESSELSPCGPGVVCRRLGRQRRLYRRHAPHHISMLEGLCPSPQMPLAFSHLRHQGTRTPDARRQPRHGRHGRYVLMNA
ncbi:MAG: hypothetical protein IJR04_05170 [Bacteroidales bacterium]|nr:hypothetical protein [Bacteroidales bacterium]